MKPGVIFWILLRSNNSIVPLGFCATEQDAKLPGETLKFPFLLAKFMAETIRNISVCFAINIDATGSVCRA
jgi:hypothetical protein